MNWRSILDIVSTVIFLAVIIFDAIRIHKLTAENRRLKAEIAKFDGDGDGKIGGGSWKVKGKAS